MLLDRVKVSYIYVIKLIITTSIVAYLMYSCNIAMLASILLNINISLASLACGVVLLLVCIGGVNLWLMLNSISNISLKVFMRSYIYGYAVNLFAPGQLGDISVTVFLKKDGVYYSRSALAYLVDKVISMLCILMTGYLGARFLFKGSVMATWIFGVPLICAVCAMACIVLIYYIPYETGKIGRAKLFVVNMYKEAVLWNDMVKSIIINITITIIKLLVLSVAYYLAFRAFGVEVKWPEVGIIPIISTLIGYVPISVGGIGTVELCAVYLFSLISVDKVYVIDVYIFLRFITYLQAGIILGLCNWQFRRARIAGADAQGSMVSGLASGSRPELDTGTRDPKSVSGSSTYS